MRGCKNRSNQKRLGWQKTDRSIHEISDFFVGLLAGERISFVPIGGRVPVAHTQESRDLPTGSMACIIGVASTTASGLAAASRAPRGTRATRAASRLGVRRAGAFAAGAPVACTAKRASLRAGAAVTPLAAIAEPDANAKAASLRPRKHAGQADEFMKLAAEGHNLIPLYRRLFNDQLTPILAYRCLVKEDERDAPSFLLESVVGGTQTGRFSFLGSRPYMEVSDRAHPPPRPVINPAPALASLRDR